MSWGPALARPSVEATRASVLSRQPCEAGARRLLAAWTAGRPGLSRRLSTGPRRQAGSPRPAGTERGDRLALGGPGVLRPFFGQRRPISLGLGLRPSLARAPMATRCPPKPLPALSPDGAGGRPSRAAARLLPHREAEGPLLLGLPQPLAGSRPARLHPRPGQRGRPLPLPPPVVRHGGEGPPRS